jgi:hypothetical protein
MALCSGCDHRASGSGVSSGTRATSKAASSEATTTSPPAFVTGGDALYGDYVRPEFGLIKKAAPRRFNDWWSVVFPEPRAWKGVVVIQYVGRPRPLGHSYRYRATQDGSLLLGREIPAPARVAAGGLERGGFRCPKGQALYAWSRWRNYAALRLRAVRDRCIDRRRILTADLSFID